MSKQLLVEKHVYRVDTEGEAQELINQYKAEQSNIGYELKKFGSQKKEKKAKGEVIEQYFLVTLEKYFDYE